MSSINILINFAWELHFALDVSLNQRLSWDKSLNNLWEFLSLNIFLFIASKTVDSINQANLH